MKKPSKTSDSKSEVLQPQNATKTFTAENFESEVLQSKLPVLVDFWAPWCGPCQMMGPVIDEVAKEFEGRASVGKFSVDTDGHQDIASKYGIQGIPAIKIFVEGEIVAEFTGLQDKAILIAEMDKILAK